MINSPANDRAWYRRAGFCLLILALSLPFAARDGLAQGAPKPLLPSLGAPKPLLPLPSGADSSTDAVELAPEPSPVDGDAAPAKDGISVDSLDAVSGETVGTIGSDDSALPATMWDGTPRSAIQRMLALVGEAPATAALRDLLLRILLSPATVPQATDAADRTSLVKARVDALERLGAWPDYLRHKLRRCTRRDALKSPGYLLAKGRNVLPGARRRVGKRRVQLASDAGTR